MNAELKVFCPHCGEEIIVEIDKKGNIISIIHKGNELKQATKEQLESKNIEFGVANNHVKGGEIN